MATDQTIDVARRTVFTTIHGATSAAEMLALQRRLLADPAFKPDFNQLVDARDAESNNSCTNDLHAMAQQNVFGAGSRRGIVVSKDVHYGMARMFEMMRDGQDEIMVFRDIDEARRWLGLDKA
jgi:hypothetical protein